MRLWLCKVPVSLACRLQMQAGEDLKSEHHHQTSLCHQLVKTFWFKCGIFLWQFLKYKITACFTVLIIQTRMVQKKKTHFITQFWDKTLAGLSVNSLESNYTILEYTIQYMVVCQELNLPAGCFKKSVTSNYDDLFTTEVLLFLYFNGILQLTLL